MKRIFIFCIYIAPLLSYAFEVKKETQQSFDKAGVRNITINNSYGNITFLHASTDSIEVKAAIVADVIEYPDTGKIFPRINHQIFKKGDELSVKTMYADDLEHMGIIHVHYYVSVPDSINIDVTNRFGNILMFDIYGTKNIVLEYGKVFCSNLSGPDVPASNYSLHYAELKADTVCDAQFYLNNSTLRVKNIKKAEVQSVYSYVFMDKITDLVANSETDKYQVENVDYVKLTGENTTCLVSKLNRFFEAELTKGILNINEISAGFTDLNLDLKEMNSEISVHPDAAFFFNAILEYGDLKYPSSIKTSRIKDIHTITYNGEYGKASESGSQIGIIGYSSNVVLK